LNHKSGFIILVGEEICHSSSTSVQVCNAITISLESNDTYLLDELSFKLVVRKWWCLMTCFWLVEDKGLDFHNSIMIEAPRVQYLVNESCWD